MSSAPAPERARRRRPILALLGAALLAHAAWGFATTLWAPPAPRLEVPGSAPLSHAGLAIELIERPVSPGRAYVDVRVGEQLFPGVSPVFVDDGVRPGDYEGRYDGRFRFAGPATPGAGFAVVEIDTQGSGAAEATWRLVRVGEEGPTERVARRAPAGEAADAMMRDLLGGPPPAAPLWPPLAGLVAGAFLLTGGLAARAPRGWPSIALVCAGATLASVFVWPIMAHQSLARTLPPVVLALVATVLAAALSGPTAQAALARRPGWRAWLGGAAYGTVLYLVYVAAQVTFNGFVAPIFRAPGGGETPQSLLLADYVAPALALVVVGVGPAAIAGAAFGGWWRRRAARSA